ncbi:UDP-N-acetylmuramoyl-L-alanyl-D-glutamate--2,6-diaminopimelate ligase [Pseudobdellovibrio exovorus]|uniref:UDP-N-acetylmuramoyl-L-alanyl-D-glutamate--2,6-diaminopimelate ligase n=1 Tax=Pseudobdellovibrio exovorus JSS TaxID=1184267 RepID=M4VA05_9BACT|nr:UDP-N-acetylmuramoyl-L-alanyl-D-glutamate--2,6-diaminopimelate ligase [Pseudobdellovibrio exovorus]AGH96237.1 UDP-N-acetylmuramoylalanyl-D-glutamate--2, 6-diaminopimelate ligase [Pseudobdellovibrio exovorus JSS]
MKLQQLFSYFGSLESNTTTEGILQQEIESICFDARQVKPNSVFVALKGGAHDGHDYLEQAITAGAVALVVENKSKIPEGYPYFVFEVPDTRQALDLLAARFYGFPSQDLFCFGVTGTNGKTSITYILEHILNHQNRLTGVMGTVNHRIGEQVWESQMTTPDAVTLQSRLKDFLDAGGKAAALEVSSHALEQRRAHSVHFNTVIFTNLTLDHLDYHKDMANYFSAKQKLFTDLMWMSVKIPKFAVINTDDPYGRRLRVAEEVIAWTYGKDEADFQFRILNMSFTETEFQVRTAVETIKAVLPVSGEHTIYNIVASAVAALSCGISLEKSFEALKSFHGVPGRLQRVDSLSSKTVFVDYAHTPDALENVLKALQSVRKNSKLNNKIITVFGCGGDRDRSKRPLMAAIAAKMSDFVVVTSDNPRTEDPQAIVDEVVKGLPPNFSHVIVEVDRDLAIKKAIEQAADDDVILIAGKGHEDYQIIGTEKRHFSDFEVARNHLNN